MNGHLVTVEVGVISGTHQRVELNGAAFNQYGLKSLNAETVEGRRTVQENRMLLDNLFKHIPDLALHALNHTLGALNVVSQTSFHKLLHNKGLEKLQGHFLRKAALEDLKLGAYHDNRTSGVVNTLTQKILTEASLLTLEHVGKGL